MLFRKANHFIRKRGVPNRQNRKNKIICMQPSLYSTSTKELELVCFLKTQHINTKCYVWKRLLFHTVTKEVNNNQAHTFYCIHVNALQCKVQMWSNAGKYCAFNVHLVLSNTVNSQPQVNINTHREIDSGISNTRMFPNLIKHLSKKFFLKLTWNIL